MLAFSFVASDFLAFYKGFFFFPLPLTPEYKKFTHVVFFQHLYYFTFDTESSGPLRVDSGIGCEVGIYMYHFSNDHCIFFRGGTTNTEPLIVNVRALWGAGQGGSQWWP